MRKINLDEIGDLEGITEKVSQFYYEAAVHALKICGHESGVQGTLLGEESQRFEITWQEDIGDDAEISWGDEEELVEYAATGIALLLISKLTEFVLFKRSPKGTQADFWLGKINEENEKEFMGLLEISGIKKETSNNRINARLKKRIKRMERSHFRSVPFYVLIVEFDSPKVKYFKDERKSE